LFELGAVGAIAGDVEVGGGDLREDAVEGMEKDVDAFFGNKAAGERKGGSRGECAGGGVDGKAVGNDGDWGEAVQAEVGGEMVGEGDGLVDVGLEAAPEAHLELERGPIAEGEAGLEADTAGGGVAGLEIGESAGAGGAGDAGPLNVEHGGVGAEEGKDKGGELGEEVVELDDVGLELLESAAELERGGGVAGLQEGAVAGGGAEAGGVGQGEAGGGVGRGGEDVDVVATVAQGVAEIGEVGLDAAVGEAVIVEDQDAHRVECRSGAICSRAISGGSGLAWERDRKPGRVW
jgi:hypothetical protein